MKFREVIKILEDNGGGPKGCQRLSLSIHASWETGKDYRSLSQRRSRETLIK